MSGKSIYITFLSIFIIILNTTAQRNMPIKYIPGKVIDKEIMRCYYLQRLQEDSLDTYSIKENKMLLQIGTAHTRYSDYKDLQGDSIAKNAGTGIKSEAEVKEIISTLMRIRTGTTSLNIFKNYPKGKITTTDRIPFDDYIYEEDIVTPKWELSTETAVICNYECKKATTRFRGRNYTAWYTPDIPINNGPWKFQGLPGLILKIEDDKKQVSFECIGIEKPKQEVPIFINDRPYIKTTKQKFEQTRKKYLDNPGAFALGTGLVTELSATASKKRPYNPIELSE